MDEFGEQTVLAIALKQNEQLKAREAQWSAVVNELREALKVISGVGMRDDGPAYGAKQIAKQSITKTDQMLKEMGIGK